MKTKSFLLAIAIILSANLGFAQKKEISLKASSIVWTGAKIGGEHYGNIQLKSGWIELKANRIIAGEFVVDMRSISNSDLKDAGYNKRLVDHLKSDDFFGVEKYPTAIFSLNNSTVFKNGEAEISGKITIKGKTEEISFKVMQKGNKYTARIELDRSKFNVRYGSKSFFDDLGDKAIDDLFVLDVVLQTTEL